MTLSPLSVPAAPRARARSPAHARALTGTAVVYVHPPRAAGMPKSRALGAVGDGAAGRRRKQRRSRAPHGLGGAMQGKPLT